MTTMLDTSVQLDLSPCLEAVGDVNRGHRRHAPDDPEPPLGVGGNLVARISAPPYAPSVPVTDERHSGPGLVRHRAHHPALAAAGPPTPRDRTSSRRDAGQHQTHPARTATVHRMPGTLEPRSTARDSRVGSAHPSSELRPFPFAAPAWGHSWAAQPAWEHLLTGSGRRASRSSASVWNTPIWKP